MRRVTKRLLILFSGVMFTYFYCEYLIYYVVVIQCSWPTVNASGNTLRTLIIADTHLLGPRNGHFFDKMRREWQMHQAFQAIMTLQRPDAVFVLGDLFDKGEWSKEEEFKYYVQRFNKLFAVQNNTAMYVVAGNHDLGFHRFMRPSAVVRFSLLLKSPLVQFLDLNGNYFVLVNSMAMHGDGCKLCIEARKEIEKISEMIQNKYNYGDTKNRTRPILMQHFPLYRLSDAECTEPDATPLPDRNKRFRNRIDALSQESSEYLVSQLQPRVVFGAHTHHGCLLHHSYENLDYGFFEYSVPSFSWRNRMDPKYMLVTFTPDQYAVNKCRLPQESTMVITAVILLFMSLYFSLRVKKLGI